MYAQAAVKGISFPQDHFKAELEKADAHPLRLSGVCRAEHSIVPAALMLMACGSIQLVVCGVCDSLCKWSA